MADQITKKLARHLTQVKQLASDVNINTYYNEIKPFLFGTNSINPIKKGSLPDGGIYKVAKNGTMSPSDDRIIIKAAGKNAKEYKIANVRNTDFIADIQPDEAGNRKKLPSEYFFPSDLVRVLTGLARIFYSSKYNITGLSKHALGSPDDLDFVKRWSGVDTEPELLDIDLGLFYEEKIERLHASDVQLLLNDVVDAAIEFENKNEKTNINGFDPLSIIENKVIADIIPQIFQNFVDKTPKNLEKIEIFEEEIKPKLVEDSEFIKKETEKEKEKIEKDIETLINDVKSDFLRDLFSITNQEIFQRSGAYDPDSKYYLFTTSTTAPRPGIKESEKNGELVYKKFVTTAIEKFLEKHGDELTQKYILPLFKKKEDSSLTGSKDATRDEGEQPVVEENIAISNPISLEEFKKRLGESILQKVVRYFLTDFSLKKNNNFSKYSHRIEERYFDPILLSIENEIDRKIISNFTIDDKERAELVQQELFALDTFDQKIFESKWYEDLLEQSAQYIQQLPSPESEYDSYLEYLYEQYVSPAIVIIQAETPEQTKAEEAVVIAQSQTGLTSGAVVPTNLGGISRTSGSADQQNDVSILTQEQTRLLQYESAWLYNRAIYELYTSQGRDANNPEYALEISNLQANIFKYINSMRVDNADEFNKLFGSAVQRQKTLLEFYQKQSILITRFQDADDLLRKSLKENANLDSSVLTQNVKNTVDSLIIQYGINQNYFAFDPETNIVTEFSGNIQHDVLWFIDTVPIDRLALIFNIPASVLKNDEAVLLALKKVLKEYAKYRGSELTLHIKNTSLQKGLIRVSAADAQKIQNGDQETIAKHLVFINDIRDVTKKHGGETVSGALDEKKDSNRKDIIRKQFKTFIPLWTQLTPDEQALVYLETLGYIPQDNPDYSVSGYPFIPEFVFFDLSKLRSVARISQDDNLSDEKKRELLEILAINEELAKEQALSDFLNDSYDYFSDESEVNEIAEHVGVDSDHISFRERYDADQEIQGDGATEYEPSRNGNGLVSKLSNSKFGKNIKQFFGNRFKKKTDPLEKSKKALRNAASGALSKAAAAGTNLIIPGAGALLAAIPNKKIRDGLSALILTALTAIVAKTIYALGSIGGLIGGFLGGAAGFILGGPAGIIPGVVVGANVGEAILPQRWTGVFTGNTSSLSTSASQQAATGVGAANNVSALTFSTASTALVTVGISTGFVLVSTLFTIFTIQSTFLIPVPTSRSGGPGGGGSPILGSFGCFEFQPAGYTKQIGNPPVPTTSIDWSDSDLATFEAGFARVASNNQYIDLLCSSGPINVYRFPKSTQGFWGWVTGPTEMILYGGVFDNPKGMEYLLIHETGHIITGRNPGLVSNFLQIKTDSSCYTYPFPSLCNDYEAFAEGLALYVTADNFFGNSVWSGPYPFKSNYPTEYNFYKNNVYGEQEY